MRRAIVLTWMLLGIGLSSQAADCRGAARELAIWAEIDQAVRTQTFATSQPTEPMLERLALVDRTNTHRLAALIARCGWPRRSRDGDEAVNDAWLLAQHADHDRRFQRRALRLIEAAVRRGEAPGRHVAYLSDRLSTAEGRPQLYGTQFQSNDGCTIFLLPIDSREAVEARRAALGMGTLAAYEAYARTQAPHDCAPPR